MNPEMAAKFVTSVTKALNQICNDYVEFDSWVQLRGQMYLDTDTGRNIEFVIDEKFSKADNVSDVKPIINAWEPAKTIQTTIHQDVDMIEELVEAAEHIDQQEVEHSGRKRVSKVGTRELLNISCKRPAAADVPTPEQPYTCNICGKGFSRESNVKIHMRLHTGERPYACDVCGKRFNTNKDLKIHQRRHTGEKPYKCGHCGRAFVEKVTLKRHLVTHNKSLKQHVCTECGRGFGRRDVLLQHHKLVHVYPATNTCGVCKLQFSSKEELQAHRFSAHSKLAAEGKPPRETNLPCTFCKETFRNKHQLNLHVRKCQEEKNVCLVCNEVFDNKLKLLLHKNKHAAQKLTVVSKTKAPLSNKGNTSGV